MLYILNFVYTIVQYIAHNVHLVEQVNRSDLLDERVSDWASEEAIIKTVYANFLVSRIEFQK